MSARWISRDPAMAQGFPVATAQAVEIFDNVALESNTIIRATDQTWASAVATPTAPTCTDTAVTVGSNLTNAAVNVKISYQFPWGEGTLSNATAVTPTARASIIVSGTTLVPPAPALQTNIYTETSAGSGTYAYVGTTKGEQVLVNKYGNGPAPYAGNPGNTALPATALVLTQYNFAQSYLGVSNQRKVANIAQIFGNSVPNLMMVMRQGIVEWDCASAAFSVGDYLAPDKDTGNDLLNQQVVKVGAGDQFRCMAIARVVVDTGGNNVVKVRGELLSNWGQFRVRP